MTIRCRRIHEPASPDDGIRVLVDRIWPRGVSKSDAKLDHWYKELAPSTELRKWFGHEPARFEEFRQRYREELNARPDHLQALLDFAGSGMVTLLFAARDTRHNNAVVLAELVREHLDGQTRDPASATCYAEEFPEYMGYRQQEKEQ